MSAILAGTQSLVKDGTAALTLSGANSYTGGTVLNDGSLLLSGGNNRLSTSGSITTTGGVLDLGGNSQTTLGTVMFAGGVVQNGTLTATGTAFVAQSGTVSAVLAGAQSLVKDGAGALTLSGANSYSGGTTLNDGSLLLSGGNDRLSTSGSITTGGGVLDLGGNAQMTLGTVTFAGGVVQNGTLTATGTAFVAQGGTVSAILAGTQGLVKDGTAALTLSGVNSYTGGTSVNDGSLLLAGGNDRLSTSGSLTTAGGVLDLGGNWQTTLGTVTFAGGIVQNGTLTATGTAFVAQSGTVSAVLSGTQGLVKDGTAALTLSGVNLYTGGTTLNDGLLLLSGGNDRLSTSGSITTGGGVLDLGGNSQTTLGTVTFSGGLVQNGTFISTGIAVVAQSGTVSALFAGTQGLTKTTSGALTLAGLNTFTGGVTLQQGFLNLNASGTALGSPLGLGTLTINGGSLGNSSGSAVTVATNNPQLWNSDFSFAGSNDLNLGMGAVTLGGSVTVTTASGSLSIGGVIAGSGFALTKSGSSTLVFAANNSYNGGTNISEGLLILSGGNDRLSTVASITATGGTLDLGGNSQTTSGTVTFSGGNIQNGTLISTGTAFVAQSGEANVVLAGTQGLVKNGSGTFSLSGANTFTGPVDVNQGTLALFGGAALADTVALTLGTNGTLALNADETIATLSGSGLLSLGTYKLTTNSSGNSVFSGALSGSGVLEKAGTGSFTVNGYSPNFTGVLRVSGGTAMLGAGSPLGNGTVEISNLGALSLISSGSLGAISGAGKVLLSGATLTLSGSQNTTLNGVISGLGAVVKTGSGDLTLNNSNTFSGGFTLAGGAVRLGSDAALGSGTLYLFGGTLSGADALNARTILNPVIAAGSAELGDVAQSAILTLSGSVSLSGSVEWNVQSPVLISNGVTALGAFGLTKTGDSTLTLGGQNTYGGGTTIAAGSLVLLPGSGGLSTSGSITSTGGVFDLGGNLQTTSGAITFAGGTIQNGTLISSGTAFIGQAGRVSAILGGTQGLVKSSSATLTLSAANSYTGGTILNEGSLVLSGGSDRLSCSGGISLLGGVLDLGGNTQTTSGAITISGVQIQNGTLTATGSAFNAQSGTVSAILAGTQGLTKTSGGVLTLLSANQYTGATTVAAGSLTISGNGSLSQSTALSVAAGATFNYFPTNAGTLNMASLSLASGAALALGWGDAIAASGVASASGSITLGLSGAFVSGQAYTLFSGGAGSSLNAAHFTLTGTAAYDYSLSLSAGEVRIIPITPTEVLSAYWVGGRSASSPKAWNAENWARDAAASTLTARTPTVLSTVFLSADMALAANQVGMTLGADTNIAGLVASSVSTMSLLDEGYLLQVGTGGIAVNAGGGSLSLAAAIDMAGNQTWSNRGAGQLTVSGSVNLGSNALQLSGSSPLVVSGTVRGTAGLLINNTSTLTLHGANSYTGGTTVSAGSVLLVGGDNRLSTSGSITAAGGVLDLGGNRQDTTGAITIAGGVVQNGILTALASAFDVRGGGASAVLAGSQALVKTTAASMTLSGANTYSGGTTIQEGLLNLNNGGNALSSAIGTGTLTILGGTFGNTSGSSVTLATQNTQVWNGDFAFAGTSDLNLGMGAVTLGNNRTVTVNTGTLTVGGLVSGGTFGITKAGPGTLVLAGGYSFSGPTQVTGGRLDIGSGVTIGTGTISLADDALLGFQLGADLTIPNKIIGGRVLTLNPLYNVFWDGGTTAQVDLIVPDGVNQTVNPGTLGWYVTVTVVEGGSLAPSTSGASSLTNKIVLSGTTSSGSEISLREDQSLTLTGTLSGTGTLAKSGAGVLTLSGTNTFTGGSEVRSGTLEILSSHALGDGSVEVGTGAILAVKAGSLGSSVSISNAISGTGELLKSGSGLVVVTGSSNTFTGGTHIGAGTLEIRQSGALGSGSVAIGASASLNVNVGANETVVLSNNISGDGYLIKESKGKLAVTSSGNKFLGTRLMDGILDVSSATALGSKLALNGGTLSSSVDLNFSIPVTVGGTLSVSPGAGSVTEMSGGFSGNGVLTKTGAGVLKISGTLSVDSGVLEVVNATSGSGGLEKAGLGTLLWSGSGTVQGSAQVAAGTLQMSGDQILRDVTKLGGGKMEVLGNSKFLGVTTLQAGTIVVNRQSALAEVPLLVVGGKDSVGSFLDVTAISSGLVVGDNINQTLKGRGTILGSVSIEAQGYLAPGNSIGTLTMGTLSFATGSIYEAEYLVSGGTGTSDLLRAQAAAGGTGLATLTGGYVLPKAISRLTDFSAHSFSIMSATVGLVGRFDGAVQTAAIGASLVYLDASASDSSLVSGTVNALKMVLQRVPYAVLGGGGVASSVGAILDANLATTEANLSAMLDGLDALQTVPQVQAVLGRVNPRAYSEVYSLAVNRVQEVQKTLSDRLISLGAASVRSSSSGGPALAQEGEMQWSAWSNVYGSSGVRKAESPSIGGSTWNTFGNVTAVERNFGSLTFGFFGAVGTASNQINSPESTISSESWQTGLYSSLPLSDRIFFDSSLLYGQADNVIRRSLPYLASATGARGEAHTEEWLLQLGFGAQLAPKETDWSAVLSAGFSGGAVRMGEVRETGVGGLGVEAGGFRNWMAMGRVGFELAKDWQVHGVPLRTAASVSWTYDFDADPRSFGVHLQGVPGNEWTITSEGRSANAFHAGASLEVGLSERRTLKIYGEEELQRSSSVFRGGVNFLIGF